MISPIIETIEGRVRLTYPHLPDFELKMDFNPIIERFNLTGNFCLLHWQAKPFGLRRWGAYDGGKDKYHAIAWNCIHNDCSSPRFLQIDEEQVKTVPTAVMLFADATVLEEGYFTLASVR